MQPFELTVVQLEEYRWRAVLTAYPNAVGYGSTRGAACEALLLCIGPLKSGPNTASTWANPNPNPSPSGLCPRAPHPLFY
jgi:hypothetical protein